MKYYAKTNTADPKIGFITTGEYLTDEQAKALGEEKLRELTMRGVLGATGESQTVPEPTEEPEGAEESEEPKDTEGTEEPKDTEEPEDAEDTEDEMPVLDAGDVIGDDPTGKSTKRGGRKAK